MADNDTPAVDTTQPSATQQPQDLHSQWSGWLDKPQNRAALMQFGIAMLQPVGFGQTGTGHFANAIGYGGEAAANVTSQEQQAQKASSEAELRAARASQAESAATAAENRQYLGAQNLDLRRQALEQSKDVAETRRQIGSLTANIRARAAYDKYVKDKAQADLINPKPEPTLDYPTWLKSTEGASEGGIASPASDARPATASTTTTGAPTADAIAKDPRYAPSIMQARQWATSPDPALRQKARQLADQIRPHVSDPHNVDAVIGLTGGQ